MKLLRKRWTFKKRPWTTVFGEWPREATSISGGRTNTSDQFDSQAAGRDTKKELARSAAKVHNHRYAYGAELRWCGDALRAIPYRPLHSCGNLKVKWSRGMDLFESVWTEPGWSNGFGG